METIVVNNVDELAVNGGCNINGLTICATTTARGIRFSLYRVLTMLDSTYRFEEVEHMVKHSNSITTIHKDGFTNDQWNILIKIFKN